MLVLFFCGLTSVCVGSRGSDGVLALYIQYPGAGDQSWVLRVTEALSGMGDQS